MEELYDDEYNFKLENFEGPLALLLEIIKKNKLDIEEVKLADLTSQYLKYMENVSLDMENASEFILMASTLIEIKSKSLLPRPEENLLDEEDNEMFILNRLKEYKLFREAGEDLHEIENVDRLYKHPDKDVGNPRFVLKDMVLDKLLDAFVGIITKVEKKDIIEQPKKIQKDRFTVAEKTISIRNILIKDKQIKFVDLFESEQTKSELINIFLAILELIKMQIAKVEQVNIFSDITIYLNEESNLIDEKSIKNEISFK
ncbi:MAG: segregation/condensation protein A [Clostridia bacterium]|nr:segregation/condensation protein A [Clostridia bacterium]MDD4686234.1 segregation/condensation protein A [Clostridia bacterium]